MKIYINVLYTLILAVIGISSTAPDENTVLTPFQTGFKCSPPTETSKYGCAIDGQNYVFYTPMVNRSVVVTVKYLNSSESYEVTIECLAAANFTDLPQIEFNKRLNLIIEECGLPSDTPLLDTVKIQPEENVLTMEIKNHDFEHETRYTSRQFDGLRKLEILIWNINTRVGHLDKDAFSKLVSLREIKVEGDMTSLIESNVFNSPPNFEVTQSDKLPYISEKTLWKKTTLRKLELVNKNVISLHPDALSNLKELEEITIRYGWLETLPDSLLIKNKNLLKFELGLNQRALALPKNLFARLPSLQKVHLYESEIQYLPNDIFKGSYGIEHILLTLNNITSLPDDVFHDQLHLKTLYLNFNKIALLPKGIFNNTRSLRILQLSNNKLSNINGNTFDSLQNLQELHLRNNNLQVIDLFSFQKTFSLRKLELQNNSLCFHYASSSSPFEHLKKLQRLNLRSNKIITVSSIWNTASPQLEHLDLSYNAVRNLSISDLRFSSSKLDFDLSKNNISTISMKQSKILPGQSITINVNSNPLICDCNILEFVQHLQSTEHQNINFMFDQLQCAEPHQLQKTKMKSLDLKKLTCPLLTVQCPKKCTCSFRSVDTKISINCCNQGFRAVPELPRVRHINFTSYELNITGNFISTLPPSNLAGYSDVTALYLTDNSIEYLSVDDLPHNLNTLDLSHNKFTEFEKLDLLKLISNNKMKALWFSGNQFHCNCPALQLITRMQQNRPTIRDVSEIVCQDGQRLDYVTANDLCFESHTNLIIILITLSICGLVFGLSLVMYYKNRIVIKIWLYNHNLIVTEENISNDKPYDAFVSYSYKDEDFVANQLIPTLETEPMSFKICWHIRDWIPGELIPTQIAQSIENSRRTLIVLSQNFLESFWGQLEFRAAHIAAMAEKRVRVIVIMYEEIGNVNEMDHELQAYLETNIYLKWGDPWFWDKLNDAISITKSANRLRRNVVS